MRRVLFTLLLLAGAAFAHSELESAAPGRDETVRALPGEVVLTFSEPLELPFSTFKVYPLEADPDEENAQRLNGLAAALMNDVLSAQGDEAARADLGVSTTPRQSTEVVLPLKDDFGPGRYVVMWRLLSVDSHSTTGFYVFTYAPES